jgi:acyl-CoA synthetase (AMP-forming)/AMP-acid ligase II
MEAAIVGPGLEFLPAPRVGELAVSGPQVALGYFNDPAKTAARFPTLDHPRLGRSRWYLTGDLAYQDEAGLFHCLGRIDNQVKVNGFRVELEEVEAHLRSVCRTDAVAAVAWPSIGGAGTGADNNAAGVVAFVSGAHVAPGDVRESLRERVPHYMVPTRVVELAALPLSTNGKVDRAALRKLLDDKDGA